MRFTVQSAQANEAPTAKPTARTMARKTSPKMHASRKVTSSHSRYITVPHGQESPNRHLSGDSDRNGDGHTKRGASKSGDNHSDLSR